MGVVPKHFIRGGGNMGCVHRVRLLAGDAMDISVPGDEFWNSCFIWNGRHAQLSLQIGEETLRVHRFDRVGTLSLALISGS